MRNISQDPHPCSHKNLEPRRSEADCFIPRDIQGGETMSDVQAMAPKRIDRVIEDVGKRIKVS